MDLTSAIMIACEMHEGQQDKAGQPYILHPLRVMLAMDNDRDRIVAVLHDAAEDNEDGWARIHDAGFDQDIIDAIDSVTRRKDDGESYNDFIKRAAAHPVGRKVKFADIEDNVDSKRLSHIPDRLVRRYVRARKVLREAIGAPHPIGGKRNV